MAANDNSLKQMEQRILTFIKERDWHQFHSPKDLAISMTLEAGEVLEHFQWKNEQEVVDYARIKKDDIGEELCDVLYWVLLMAHDLKIDLPQAFEKKMQQNEAKYPAAKVKGSHKKYTHYQEKKG